MTISFNNFLETIPLFKKEYKVSAIFIFNSWTKGNVIRFTLGNDWYQLGDTHPAVWMDTTGVRQTEISRGSIRSSPRNGLSTPYRLTVRTVLDCSTMFFSTLETCIWSFQLNLSTLNAGILIMVQQVRLMLFSLDMVDYPISSLLQST